MTPAYSSELVLIRRRLTEKFTQIPNDLVRNKSLNWKSLGLLIYLLSLPPTKFQVSLAGLCNARIDGEAAMRNVIKQLEGQGYMKIVRERSTLGRFVRSRWFVSDEPIVDWAPYIENPAVEKPNVERPVLGEQGTTNTYVLEIQKNSNTTTRPKPPAAAEQLEIDQEADKEIWLWLCQKLSIEPEEARQDCAGLNAAMALDVLCEAYECKRQGSIRKSVQQFLGSLIRKAREGKFNLSAGTELRKDIPQILKRQKALQIASEVVPIASLSDPQIGTVPPRERLRQLRDEMARDGNMPRMTGTK